MVQKAENARERFESAAYDLFGAQGYVSTTVPEIAAKAGLTERTFYRYFAAKREVLFWRAGAHRGAIADEIARAPAGVDPLKMVANAFESLAPFIDGHRPIVELRQFLISTHVDLHERELMKVRMLASAVEVTLQQRGIQPSLSRVAAEIGAAIWKDALERWIADERERSFVDHAQASLREFQAGLRHFAG